MFSLLLPVNYSERIACTRKFSICLSIFFWIAKLNMHLVSHDPINAPSTPFSWEKSTIWARAWAITNLSSYKFLEELGTTGWCLLSIHWSHFLKQDLLEDPAITSAIDEETEFNALVVCHWLLDKVSLVWFFLFVLCVERGGGTVFLNYGVLYYGFWIFIVFTGGRGGSSWIIEVRGKITQVYQLKSAVLSKWLVFSSVQEVALNVRLGRHSKLGKKGSGGM